MGKVRHTFGLAIFLGLIAAACWIWVSYPQLGRLELLRPWRAELTSWRLPILALLLFAMLSGLQWLWEKLFDRPGKSES